MLSLNTFSCTGRWVEGLFLFPLFLWLLESRVLPSRAELSSNKQIWLQVWRNWETPPGSALALLCLGREEGRGWRKAGGGFGARELTEV